MNKLGEIIKKTRISKGYSISQISTELKISEQKLKEIEDDVLVPKNQMVFYLGNLRSYLSFLELDTNYLINEFKNNLSLSKINNVENIPKPILDVRIINYQKITSASLILIIFTSFYFLFVFEKKVEVEYAMVPDIPESAVPIVEKLSLEMSKEIKSDVESFSNIENISNDYTSVNASSDFSDVSENTTVTLKLLNPTWVQLRDNNDNIVISQLMEKNEEFSYDISLKYNITAGNAGNILIIINNDVRGKIGKYGEVIDSFIIDNNFYN